MIIPLDADAKLKDVQQADVVVNRAAIPDDPPPAYTNSQPQSRPVAGPIDSPLPPIPVPDSVKPTNYLSLSRGNSSIRGTYVIDPRINIPQFLLPPLAADETEATRKNVFLHTTNGSIDVAIHVVGDGDSKQKVEIALKSSNGGIATKLHASSATRPPLSLKAQTSNGSIVIHVPRSFRGPVTIRTRNGSVRFSDALSVDLVTFNEVNNTRRYFIGDLSDLTEQPEGWFGDEINLESSNGGIKLQYDAEPILLDTGSKGKGKGIFGRLLGL